jgi:hypothetical protein
MLKHLTILLFIVSSAGGFYRKPYSTLQNTRVFCQIYDHEFHLNVLGRKLDKNSSRIRIRITLMRLKHWLQYSQIWKKPIPDMVPGVKTALDPGSGSATLILGFGSRFRIRNIDAGFLIRIRINAGSGSVCIVPVP